MTKPKRMKPVKAFAVVLPNGFLRRANGEPCIWSNRGDAVFDTFFVNGSRVARVEIREIK